MEQTDEKIISDYIQGDEKVFSVLIERHLKSVYGLAYALTQSETEAEDIVQETFIKLWKNIKKYKNKNNTAHNFKSWLLTITRNTAYDFLRKRKNIPFSNFEDEYGSNKLVESLASHDSTAEELAIASEEKKEVQKAVAKISPTYREVLALRYSEELTFKEIGIILGKPLNTVKSQYQRALRELYKILHQNKNI